MLPHEGIHLLLQHRQRMYEGLVPTIQSCLLTGALFLVRERPQTVQMIKNLHNTVSIKQDKKKYLFQFRRFPDTPLLNRFKNHMMEELTPPYLYL